MDSFVLFIQSGAMNQLVLLDIAGNAIDHVAFSLICDAIVDNQTPLALKALWIGGCNILDSGIIMFTSLIRNGFLPQLSTLCSDSTCWMVN